MPYTAPEQALRVASAISAVTTGCCLRYGVFANVLRSRPGMAGAEADPSDAFYCYYDLLRTIVISNTEDQVQRTSTWLVCRIAVPEPAERYFLQGFHRWSVEWVEVADASGPVLTTNPVLLSTQSIVGLREGPSSAAELPGAVRLIALPGQVPLDIVVQKYVRATASLGTDQLLAALRQWGAHTLPGDGP